MGKEKTIFRDRNSVWPEATLFQAVSGVEVMSLGPFQSLLLRDGHLAHTCSQDGEEGFPASV